MAVSNDRARVRLYFLDNLRVIAIMLVIAHHAAMPYGPTGGTWPIREAAQAEVLAAFFTANRSFGMSLFFMIAGYFTVMSCDKSGPRAFIKGRLARLGIPLLAMALVFTLLNVLVFGAEGGRLGPAWPIEVGHFWFVEHLLVYSLVYAMWRTLRPRRDGAARRLAAVPRWWTIVGFSLALGLVSGVVRIWFPVDDLALRFRFARRGWRKPPSSPRSSPAARRACARTPRGSSRPGRSVPAGCAAPRPRRRRRPGRHCSAG